MKVSYKRQSFTESNAKQSMLISYKMIHKNFNPGKLFD